MNLVPELTGACSEMPPGFEELLLDLETTFIALLTPFDMSTGDSRAAMFFDGSLL